MIHDQTPSLAPALSPWLATGGRPQGARWHAALGALAVTLALAPAPAGAQEQASSAAGQAAGHGLAEDYDEDENEIVVTAPRMRGSVDIPQAPVAVLGEEEILSLGAGSLQEVLEEIAPQTSSAGGRGDSSRPAVLVNGQRVSGFRELRNYPPEAIKAIEILPEEAALRFGFSPNQRVINFILKDNYASKEIELEYQWPGAGGYAANEAEGSMIRIDGPNRINIGIETSDSSMLTEGERGVSSTGFVPEFGDANPADYRSLVADSRDLELNAGWTRGLGEDGDDGSISVTGAITRSDSVSLRGPDIVTLSAGGATAQRVLIGDSLLGGARVRDTRTAGFETGVTFDRPIGDWSLNLTGNWAHAEESSRSTAARDTSALRAAALSGQVAIDAPILDLLESGYLGPQFNDRSRSNTETATSLATLTGRPVLLPAGEVALTLKAGFDWSNIRSSDTRNPGIRTDLTRGDAIAGFTVGIPIASRRDDAWAAIGDLTLDLSGGVRHLSDFGTLYDWSAGLTWSPVNRLDIQLSHIYQEAPPSLTQLGAPTLLTSGATIYDIATGQTVLVDLLTGGNPNLVAEKQSDWKIGINYDLPIFDRSTFTAEYYDETSTNVSSAFPALTPAIEAAFPDRVVRDAAGNLISIDQRPVTFARQTGRRLRYGIDISDRISGSDSGGEGRGGGGAGRGGRGGAGGDRAGGGSSGGPPDFGGGRSGGRWSLGFYHTIRFDQSVQIAPGSPSLDLLDGQSITSTPVARHELELQGRIFYNGFGLRLSGDYLGGASIRDDTGTATSLRFDPIATFDARFFVDLDRQASVVEAVPFLKGARVSFGVDNIFDAQQRVTDANGDVPISYLPDFTDPAGRFFEIEFRKRF